MNSELRKAIERAITLLEEAGKVIAERGDGIEFAHDITMTDHIGFATDCENAVSALRGAA